jgi:hypothetical protein
LNISSDAVPTDIEDFDALVILQLVEYELSSFGGDSVPVEVDFAHVVFSVYNLRYHFARDVRDQVLREVEGGN